MLSHLSATERERVLKAALALMRQIKDSHRQELLRGALAAFLPFTMAPEAIMTVAAQESFWQWQSGKALAATMARLNQPEKVLAIVNELQAGELLLEDLAPLLAQQGHAEAVLAAVARLENEYKRSDALVAIAPYLPDTLLAKSLAIARRVPNNLLGSRSAALLALLPRLPAAEQGQVSQEILKSVRKVGNQAEVLVRLAPHLSASLLSNALVEARLSNTDGQRAPALAALASRLPAGEQEAVLHEAMAAAQAIADERWRSEALAEIAPHLSSALLDEMVTAVDALNTIDRTRALKALIPRLVEAGDLEAAWMAARSPDYEVPRVDLLLALAAHLPAPAPEQALQEALAAAKAISWSDHQSGPLLALVGRLAELGLFDEAWMAIREITWGKQRVMAQAKIAPYLPPAERLAALKEGLAVAHAGERDLQDVSKRQEALAKLAPEAAALPLADLLSDLQALAPVIAALGRETAVVETFNAVAHAGRWWP